MIVLSTVTQSATGTLKIREHQDSKFAERTSRVSRTATLDGGCLLVHGGVSASDRTLNIKSTDMTESEVSALKSLYVNETLLILSCSEGCFEGVIEQIKTDRGQVTFTFLCRVDLTES